MRKKIIFVDDEEQILKGLQRTFHSQAEEWEMMFFNNAEQALGVIRQMPIEIVVSDIRMPGMNGIQFFSELKKIKPDIIRIFLSGQTEQDMLIRSVDLAHQFIYKPCDAPALKSVLEHSFTVRDTLMKESLKAVIARMDFVPPLPSTYRILLEKIQSVSSSTTEIGNIIGRDIGLSAKILKLVNSAYFSLNRKISSPSEAVTYLGLETVKAIVLSMEVNSLFEKEPLLSKRIEKINDHSIKCSLFAKELAIKEGKDKIFFNNILTAGLLHDMGKLMLYANFPDESKNYRELTKTEGSCAAERKLFGSTHAEIGAYLMGLWGLPDTMISSVAFHHEPLRSKDQMLSPLTLVYFVDTFLNMQDSNEGPAPSFDNDYLQSAGVLEKKAAWSGLLKEMNSQKTIGA